jgi:hypothetical protein
LEFARNKCHPAIGKRHLLFGMLDSEGGLLVRRLKEQAVDARRLADLLYAETAKGDASPALGLALTWLDDDLVRLLCAAERYAGPGTVGEDHLLRSLHVAGAGDAAALLIRNSVKWRSIV